jgi:hypothetical protein
MHSRLKPRMQNTGYEFMGQQWVRYLLTAKQRICVRVTCWQIRRR